MNRHTLYPLAEELEYSRRMQLLCGILVFALSVTGFFLAKWYYHHELSEFVQGVCLVVGLFGLYAVVHAWRMLHIERHNLMQLVLHRPRDVVWVYSYVSVNMPYGVRLFRMATIYICDRYGETESMMVRSSRLKRISDCLESEFTWSTFGYSVKKEQLYRANPEMLYQD